MAHRGLLLTGLPLGPQIANLFFLATYLLRDGRLIVPIASATNDHCTFVTWSDVLDCAMACHYGKSDET